MDTRSGAKELTHECARLFGKWYVLSFFDVMLL